MTLRVLIVDDEPAARRGIRRLLELEPDVEVIGECGDGATAVEAIVAQAPSLVVLDIQMPELDGFDVIDAIGLERMPAVVFVTAYDAYAVRAFEVNAIDYVLKPVDAERFRGAIARARTAANGANGGLVSRIAAALETLGRTAPSRWAKRVAIRAPGRVTLVAIADIDRLEAAGNYVEIHAAGRMHLMREALATLEQRLDPERFVRVSRSAIVNVERIRELQPMFNGDFVVILSDGTQVSGSRRFRAGLGALLGPGA